MTNVGTIWMTEDQYELLYEKFTAGFILWLERHSRSANFIVLSNAIKDDEHAKWACLLCLGYAFQKAVVGG